MPQTIEPTERDSEADRQRIARINRNRRIREAYQQRECGRQEAWQQLGEEYGLSPSTVRQIIYKQR